MIALSLHERKDISAILATLINSLDDDMRLMARLDAGSEVRSLICPNNVSLDYKEAVGTAYYSMWSAPAFGKKGCIAFERHLTDAVKILRGYGLTCEADRILECYRNESVARAIDYAKALLIDIAPQDSSGDGRLRHAETEVTVTESHARQATKRITRDEANLRARAALKNPKLRSTRKLARAIGCSVGLVSRLPAWLAYQEERKRLGVVKAAGPKAVGLTDRVLASAGRNDTELVRLLAEQAADEKADKMQCPRRKKV